MIAVVLVDDHASFREALALILDHEPDISVVGQAGRLDEARPLLRRADVALIDLGLAGQDGLQLLPELHDVNPRAAALIVTASASRSEMARAVALGAAGVLHKSVNVQDMVDAVRGVAQGACLFTPTEREDLVRLAARQRDAARDGQMLLRQLTAREREVLHTLSEGLSDKLIARRLQVSPETVRSHMVRILSKLAVHSRLEALVFGLRHGEIEIP